MSLFIFISAALTFLAAELFVFSCLFRFDDESFKFRVLNGVQGVEELITLLYLLAFIGVFGDLVDDLVDDLAGDLADDLDWPSRDLNETFNDLDVIAGDLEWTTCRKNRIIF